MLHGLGANSIELADLAKHLYGEGFSVHLPHIENYSFGSPPGTVEQWLEHVLEHYWKMKSSYETVSVVGLSMGATLALRLASIETPTSVVALSSCLAYDGWAIPFYSFLLRLAPYIPYLQKYRFAESEPYGIKNEAMRSRVKKALKADHIAASGADSLSYKQISQGLILVDDIWNHLKKIRSPLLFIHAADDETVHPNNITRAMKIISSDHKRLHLLGDSYHMITVDNERETVNHETSFFLKQQVNASLAEPAFEMAPLLLPELRRLVRNT